jgi:hypothetical protein
MYLPKKFKNNNKRFYFAVCLLLVLLGRMIAGGQRKEEHTGLVLWGKWENSQRVQKSLNVALSQSAEKDDTREKVQKGRWTVGI